MPVIVAASHIYATHTVQQFKWEQLDTRGLIFKNKCGQVVNYLHEGQELGGFPSKTKVYLAYFWEKRKDAHLISRLINSGTFIETNFEE